MAKGDSLYLFRLARERAPGGRERFAAAMGDLFLEHFPTMTEDERTLSASLSGRSADPMETMTRALSEGKIAPCISLSDERTKLGYSRIMRLLQDQDGHGLAVACKAAGIGKGIFVDIYGCCRRARDREYAGLVGDVRQALTFYDRLDAQSAKAVVKDWWGGTGCREALCEAKFP